MKMLILDFFLALIENFIIFIFSDHLMHKRFKSGITWLVTALICSAISLLFTDMNFYLRSFLSIIMLLISFVLLYKDSIFIKIGIVVTSLYFLYITDIVIGNILTIAMGKQLYNVFYSNFINRVIVCLAIKPINALIFWMDCKMFSKVELELAKKKWILYDVIVVVFMVISIMFIHMYSFAETDFLTSVLFIGISTVFFIMSIIVIYFFTEICSSFQKEKRLYEIQASFESMHNIIVMQNHTNTQLQKIRHDMKNHILSVNQLFDEGNTTEAHKLLLQTVDFVSNIDFNLKSRTGNSLIDAKVASIAARCENDGINFSYNLETLPEIKITLLDLSALLSNLFDNAVEASKKCIMPKIEVKIFSYKEYIYINTINSFSGEIDEKKGRLLSTKSHKYEHGYGTQIIKEICEKYEGAFTWKRKDNLFISNIIFLNE